eukprot:2873878-Heterocapsa_arctica.AAC.1
MPAAMWYISPDIPDTFFQDGPTGSARSARALNAAPPPHAFQDELGVQAPAGFWHSAGLPPSPAPPGLLRDLPGP